MSTLVHTPSHDNCKRTSVARTLNSMQRQEIALEAMSHKARVTQIASGHNVSRKFVYQQKEIALSGIEEVFSTSSSKDSLLFQLPVTKEWIKQFTLSLVLIGHSSYQ